MWEFSGGCYLLGSTHEAKPMKQGPHVLQAHRACRLTVCGFGPLMVQPHLLGGCLWVLVARLLGFMWIPALNA